uniref:Myosin motor domain-containing protein n=1 Tax=Gongylonema pulchrum TaxID=637853 RepID=A0A183CYZ6_9BILA
LPNGRESSVEDVKEFIKRHALVGDDQVQFGITKVFMRDAEKLLLDDHLHRAIMKHIETLQHWFRALLTRRRYVRLRSAIIAIQVPHITNLFDF